MARGNPARWWIGRSCGGASRAPRTLLVGRFRRLTSLLVLAFLLTLLGGLRLVTNPQRLSKLSEVLLSRVLGGNVRVETARLSLSGTLLLSGVEVRPDDSQVSATSDIPIFAAEQIEARFDWFSLLSGQLSATQLVATKPVFRAIEERDSGHWNFERLRPSAMSTPRPRPGSKPGLSLPVVILRDAHVKWGEAQQGRVEQTAETVIDGDMMPDPLLTSTYHFQFSQLAPGNNMQPPLAIGATLHGTWDSATSVFSLTTENVTMSDALRNGLPRQAREWCDEHHLAGRLSQLKLTFNPRDGLALAVAFDGVSMMWMIAPETGIAVGEERPAYPLDVRNVRGRMVFALGEPAMHIIDLSGDVLGYHFVADCDVKGANFDAPYTLHLRFPHANLGDRYPPLFLAFLSSQDLIQRVQPHGLMDISVDVQGAGTHAPPTFNGIVDFLDARLRYAHVPFPLDHVKGRITFDEQSVTFHDVRAKANLNDVCISGSSGTVWNNRALDITVSSQNTYFDDLLAACLPEKFQDIWNSFAVRGHGGFVCTVTRGKGIMDPQKIAVDVDLDDASGYIKAFPYPFSRGSGHLHFEPDQTRIEHLTARTGADGSGAMTLDGIVRHDGADVTHLLPELHLTGDVPLDIQLLHALPVEFTDKLRDTTLDGRLSFDATVRRPPEPGVEPALQFAGTVKWKDGTLHTRLGEQPMDLSNIAALAVISPAAIDLQSFNGNLNLDAKGATSLAVSLSTKLVLPSMSGEMQLDLKGKEIALPATAPTAFPKVLSDAWRDYAPSGHVDLAAAAKIRVNLPADEAAVPEPIRVSDAVSISTYKAAITLKDAQLTPTSWPMPLGKLQGSLEVVPGRISMANMSGTLGNITLSWQGQILPETGRVTLSGSAESAGWPVKWMSYLPEAIVSRLDLKREDSTLSLRVDSLTREASDMPWSYAGALLADNVATTGNWRTQTQHVALIGNGVYTPADPAPSQREPGRGSLFDFTGRLAAENFTMSDHVFDTLKANVQAQGATHAITFSDIDGHVAQGALQGKLLIRTAGAPEATQPAATMTAGERGGGGGV